MVTTCASSRGWCPPPELIEADSSGNLSGELAPRPRRGAVLAKRFVGGPGDAVEAFFLRNFFLKDFSDFFVLKVLSFASIFLFLIFLPNFFAQVCF
jgi:hypothetical protein